MTTTVGTLNNEYLLAEYFFFDLQTGDDNERPREPNEKNWVNPYSRSTIKPYIPSDSQELVKICGDAYTKYLQLPNFNTTGALFYELKEPFVITFSQLDPRDLANFSKVSKCCYLATKYPIIWELQMNKLLPNVKILPTELCQFSSEQQFKIIFKRINDELKPYVSKQKRNFEILNELRGPNGMNGTIDAAWKDLEQKAGLERAIANKPVCGAYSKYIGLDFQMASLQHIIDSKVPNVFNDQDQFEKIIRTSETQTNVQNLTDDSTEDAINGTSDSVKDSNPP